MLVSSRLNKVVKIFVDKFSLAPYGESLGALLVGVLLLSSSLTLNLHSLLTQSLLNAFKPGVIKIQPFSSWMQKIPMKRVCLTPLVEKSETVSQTHGEAVLSEAGALKVLTETIGLWTLYLEVRILVSPS